jgi:hypothetical protein
MKKADSSEGLIPPPPTALLDETKKRPERHFRDYDRTVRSTFRLTVEAVEMCKTVWDGRSLALFFDIAEDDTFVPESSKEGFWDYVRQIEAAREHAPTVRKTIGLYPKTIRHFSKLAKLNGVPRDCIVEAIVRSCYTKNAEREARRNELRNRFSALLSDASGYKLLDEYSEEFEGDLLLEALRIFLNICDQYHAFLDTEDPKELPF